MQLWLGLIGLAGALGGPAVAGLLHLRATTRERRAKSLDEKADTVRAEAVDVYALLQASIVREAAEKAAHGRTKRRLAAARAEIRELRAASKK